MTLPANIRVNVGAPFPTVIKGSGPVSIGRANGIWTIGASFMLVQLQNPPNATALATDYVLVWDSVANQWLRVSLATLMAGNQRSITAGPVAIAPTDYILHLNLSTGLTITLPSYQTRNGLPLIFKDVGMHAGAQPLTLAAAAGETIDGAASIPLNTNGQSIRIVPANDGVNAGWFQE